MSALPPHQHAVCLVLVLSSSTLACAGPAVAQGSRAESARDYPVKATRMIVPLAPGGGSDIVGRIVANALSESWGQSVIVDNRPGAGSTVGTSIAAKAAPDGYTMLVSSSSIAMSPALYGNLDFDIRRDFAGVSLLAGQPSMLAVHSSVPATSVKQLVAVARAQPGKLSFGSAGIGSATHLGTELFNHTANTRMLHVPYKSAGLATTALLSGETQVLLTNMASVLPHAGSGKIRLLGISSAQRSPAAPDVPTIAEAGAPGYEFTTWYGMLMPAGTPRRIVAQVQADVAKVMQSPHVKSRLTAQGLEVYASRPAEFEAFLASEVDKWGRVIRATGVRAQ